jgi:hypothetical protein
MLSPQNLSNVQESLLLTSQKLGIPGHDEVVSFTNEEYAWRNIGITYVKKL